MSAPKVSRQAVGARRQSAATLRRIEKDVQAYLLWVELRNFKKVGERLGIARGFARDRARSGWRVEVRVDPDAECPGKCDNEFRRSATRPDASNGMEMPHAEKPAFHVGDQTVTKTPAKRSQTKSLPTKNPGGRLRF